MRQSVNLHLRSHCAAWENVGAQIRPYPHWADYADKLVEYSHQQQSRLKGKLPDGVSLHSWLLDNEDVLREDKYQREKNAVVAYQLLPIFEDTPTGWNALRNFPTSKGYLKEYLRDWYSSVESEDKPFVARLSDTFGYTINENVDELQPD